MGRGLIVATLAVVGLLCAAGMGYAAYVVSRGSVAVPVTRLQQSPQTLTPREVRAKAAKVKAKAKKRVRTTTATTRTVTPPPPPTTTVDDHGGDRHGGRGSGGGGDDHGGDD
jgi:hypothetical protein